MHRRRRVRLTVFLAVMAWLVVLPPAHAYIDPGSTSVIFQALVAGIAAAGTALAVSWTRVRQFFGRLFGSQAAEPEPAPDPERSTEQA